MSVSKIVSCQCLMHKASNDAHHCYVFCSPAAPKEKIVKLNTFVMFASQQKCLPLISRTTAMMTQRFLLML